MQYIDEQAINKGFCKAFNKKAAPHAAAFIF
jgi:hypothetical protein